MSRQNPALPARDGFEREVAPLRPDLYRYAYWLTKSSAEAEDLVQETLLRAWRARDSLKDAKALKSWLITILKREFARALKARKDREAGSVGSAESLAVTGNTDVDDVRSAIWRLPDDYREPLVLQVLMGYSTAEIAAMLEINQGAVLTRLHRARRKLRGELEDKLKAKVRGQKR
jgi:RNA polymerase sigma-70 factor (ECF subfamily)